MRGPAGWGSRGTLFLAAGQPPACRAVRPGPCPQDLVRPEAQLLILPCWGLGFSYEFSGAVNVQCMATLDELVQAPFKAVSDRHSSPTPRACYTV